MASKRAKDCVDFLGRSVTAFHATENVVSKLKVMGYQSLNECAKWPNLAPQGKYYVTRNDSTIVAFAVGGKYKAGNGLKVVGAHTDSPNLALKPKTHAKKHGYLGVGVQPYGGGLWHTWFDRDLTIAGRVVMQRENETHITSTLVNLKKPILRIPNLAIHLTSGDERTSFGPNKEKHVAPILGTVSAAGEELAKEVEGQSKLVMQLLAKECGCKETEILDFDLSIVDTQTPIIGGAFEEFIFSPRIDNLVSCYCAIAALEESDSTLVNEDMVRVIALYDNEEVGSSSAQGAGGTLMNDIVERLHTEDPSLRTEAIANSFMFSVDGAHALHPNYADRHEEQHRPAIDAGPTIKYNANQRYATTGVTAATVKALARKVGVPIQSVCVKNDSPCGSTIGPIMSTLTGIPTVDLGNPMLSMHSIREMCGTKDVDYLTELIDSFFKYFQEIRHAK